MKTVKNKSLIKDIALFSGIFFAVIFAVVVLENISFYLKEKAYQDLQKQVTVQGFSFIPPDKLLLQNGETIKLTGVSCPEYMQSRVDRVLPKEIILKKDRHSSSFYAYTKEGTLINKTLLKQGYCKLNDSYKFDMKEIFKKAQYYAKLKSKGIWKDK